MEQIKALPDPSRVWIYQAGRQLTDKEAKYVEDQCRTFVQDWAAHGKGLQAYFSLVHQRFLVLAVNEDVNEASGCSIDSSVQFIKELENALNISFLDRSQIAYQNNGSIETCTLPEIRKKVEEGGIGQDTLVFDNSISNVRDLREKWPVPASSSWLSRYF